jgi:hypothetical protein
VESFVASKDTIPGKRTSSSDNRCPDGFTGFRITAVESISSRSSHPGASRGGRRRPAAAAYKSKPTAPAPAA